MNMKEFFASPAPARPTELERARMRKVLDKAPLRPRHLGADDSVALVSEMRAMRSEITDLRKLIESRQAPANDEILSRKQTADLLGYSVETVTKRAREDGLPHKLVGKEYRFLRSQVMAWMAARGEALAED